MAAIFLYINVLISYTLNIDIFEDPEMLVNISVSKLPFQGN